MAIRSKRLIITWASAMFLAPLLYMAPASAAAYTVNSTADAPDASPGNGVCAASGGACTLRAAVMEANAQAAANPGSPNKITVPGGTYVLTGVKGEEHAATGDLDVNRGTLTITGAGPDSTVIDANNVDRAFHVGPVAPTRFTLDGVAIRNGNALSSPANTSTSGPDIGGAIRVERNSALTVTNALFESNRAGARGGAVGMPLNAATTAGSDPAITTVLTDVIMRNNTAVVEGGAFFSNRGATLTRVIVENNTVTGTSGLERGAGISNSGDLTLIEVVVRGNSMTAGFGGGISNRGDPAPPTGPPVFGTIRLNVVTVEFNTAPQGGGIVNGNGATAILVDSTLIGNVATTGGPSGLPPVGGFGNLGFADLTNVVVRDNFTTTGTGAGGVGTVGPPAGHANARMVLRNSVLLNNSPRNCLRPPPPFVRAPISAGGNYSSDASCGF